MHVIAADKLPAAAAYKLPAAAACVSSKLQLFDQICCCKQHYWLNGFSLHLIDKFNILIIKIIYHLKKELLKMNLVIYKKDPLDSGLPPI